MRYWKIIYRTGEEDFEAKEVIIDNDQYKLIQSALIRGEDFIVLKDKPSIKRTSIASISEADKEVLEYQRQGIKVDGLLEPAEQPKLTGTVISGLEKADMYLKRTAGEFKKRMGWE